MKSAEDGLRIPKRADSDWPNKFLVLKAEIYLWSGRKAEVPALLESAPPGTAGSAESAALSKIVLATAIREIDLPKAQVLLNDARQIANSTLPGLLCDVAVSQGLLDESGKNMEAARQRYLEALELARKGEKPFVEAEALGDLGRLLTAIRHYDESVTMSMEALKVTQSHGYRYLQGGLLLNLGWNYLELGDFDASNDALKQFDSISSDDRLKQIVISNQGRIELSKENYDTAKQYFNRALSLAEKPDSEEAADAFDNLARAALGSGDIDTAENQTRKALDIFRSKQDHPEELRVLLTAAAIADARKNFTRAAQLLDQVMGDKDTPHAVRLEAENEQAHFFALTGQIPKAKERYEDLLNKIESERGQIAELEHKLAFASWEASFYTKYISFLVDQDDAIGSFEAAELGRARTLKEEPDADRGPLIVKAAALQKLLGRQNEIVLAYWLAPKRSFLWVSTFNRVRVFILPAKRSIEEKVKLYQKDITDARDTESGNEFGEALYRILVEPARDLIPHDAHVVIIPDGSLGQLNFETLLVPGARPHLWIRDVELQDAHSASALMKHRLQSPTGKALIIGNPLEADPQYAQLLYAQKEMDEVAAQFPGREITISGAQAVPSAYVKNHPGDADVLQFSSHGTASETSPLDSAIILSPEKDGSFKLYAREIIKIPLKARIVVVSACYGAGKRTYSAEGLVGLAWAFLRAGAHQVIAGLWDVNDEVTPELMRDFYAEWRKSKNAAGALRLAKLKMLNSGRKAFRRPYYWASLQLYTGSRN